jgi:hypothetical protein
LLNLTEGLAGTLFDRCLETRLRNDRNGASLEEKRKKRVQSAIDAIDSNQRITAGLHVSAGRFLLGPDLLAKVSGDKAMKEEKLCEMRNKMISVHRALRVKMVAIRELEKSNEELNVSQLRTMVTWYKHAKDPPMPTKRQDLLTRLNETCNRNDPQEPARLFPSIRTGAASDAASIVVASEE